jgi:TrpR-related protein YerC/YecD
MKRRFTEESWRKEPWMRALVAAIHSLKTEEDVANFLRDVATLSEMQALSERLEVARLLAQGYSYRQVAKATGASTTTVTRVAHFLENGEGGYRTVLKAHRHHRLVKPEQPHTPLPAPFHGAQASTEDLGGAQIEEKKPMSPLQKYLERKSEQ